MGQEDGDLFYLEFRPQGHHRLYIITPQRLFTPLSGLPTNPVGECTLIRPNNGPCVPLSVVGGAEVTIRPPLINTGNIFQKDSKSSEKRLRQTDRRTGKGPIKLQIGTS